MNNLNRFNSIESQEISPNYHKTPKKQNYKRNNENLEKYNRSAVLKSEQQEGRNDNVHLKEKDNDFT